MKKHIATGFKYRPLNYTCPYSSYLTPPTLLAVLASSLMIVLPSLTKFQPSP